MSIISLMLVLLSPIQMSKWRTPIQTSETCLSSYLVRMEQCRTDYPDSTSIQRAVCEADAAGQYTSCINSLR